MKTMYMFSNILKKRKKKLSLVIKVIKLKTG